MPTERMYPMDAWDDNFNNELSDASTWYRDYSSGQDYTEVQADTATFNEPYVGIGANSQDSGATEVWYGKTQTWTAAKIVFIVSEGNQFLNDTDVECWIYNHNTAVDLFHTVTEGSETNYTTVQWSLDVADWGTNFSQITNAQIRFIRKDLGVDATLTAAFRFKELYIEGTFSGSGTLTAREVPRTNTGHNGNWSTVTNTTPGGWFHPFSNFVLAFTTASFPMNADPDHDIPVVNVASGWTDKQNGQTPTAANFILEHNITGLDNDQCQIDLVRGATPTQLEILWNQQDGNGDFTETSANISSPATWNTCAIRHRYTSQVQMMDNIAATIYRIFAEVDFPSIAGTAYDITASSDAAVDSNLFLAGELLVGGFGNLQNETETFLEKLAIIRHDLTAVTRGLLDSTLYLHGAFEIEAVASAQLDSLLGSRLDSATIPDTVFVRYTGVIKDPAGVLPDVEVPITKITGTLRKDDASQATVVIPDSVTHLPLIVDYVDGGEFNLKARLEWLDGFVEFVPDVIVLDLTEMTLFRSAGESYIQITGSKSSTFGSGNNWLIQTEGSIEESIQSGKREITTLHDPRVKPGDFIDMLGASQVEIKEVVLNISPSTRLMTLREL